MNKKFLLWKSPRTFHESLLQNERMLSWHKKHKARWVVGSEGFVICRAEEKGEFRGRKRKKKKRKKNKVLNVEFCVLQFL